MTCKCGNLLASSKALQCDVCSKAAVKKLMKIAAAAGILLGLVCSSMPSQLQTVCKSVSVILATCS